MCNTNMLEKIREAIENTTDETLLSRTVYLKIFCGLANKHSYFSQKEIAEYLSFSPSRVGYYIREHSNMLSNTEYKKLCQEVETKVIS